MATARASRRRLVVLAVLAACHDRSPTPPRSLVDQGGVGVSAATAESPPPPGGARPHRSPLLQSELPTTDSAIAAGNFLAQLDSFQKIVARAPRRPDFLARLAGLYAAHAQFFGRLDGYERAAELADRLVGMAPKDSASYVARASARLSLHRFDGALADIAAAEKLGARQETLEPLRVSLLEATGRFDEALAIAAARAKRWPTLESLAAEAGVRADRGELEEADRLFTEAQYHFDDSSAFPVAWLYLQQGLLWQKAGRMARARELFVAARERLAPYAAATAHLAAVDAATGDRAAAIALLEPLVAATDDPEYPGQLSQLYRDAGRTADADRLRAAAARRFDELVARHPEAFADHAARFWLGPGGEPARALPLARKNLATRRTPDAYELALEAALAAADDAARTCTTADEALALPRATAHLHVLASRAYAACGKKERADAELRAAAAAAPGASPTSTAAPAASPTSTPAPARASPTSAPAPVAPPPPTPR